MGKCKRARHSPFTGLRRLFENKRIRRIEPDSPQQLHRLGPPAIGSGYLDACRQPDFQLAKSLAPGATDCPLATPAWHFSMQLTYILSSSVRPACRRIWKTGFNYKKL